MNEEEKIISFLDSHEKEIVAFTQQLVRIRSENGNETSVAKAIQKKLHRHGIKSRLVGKDKSRMNLVAAIGKGRKSLILNGHLDTVKVSRPEKWKMSPFGGKIVANRLFGRGSADMKSGLAAITFAAIALSKIKLNGKLLLAFSSDEESGKSSGIEYLLREGLKANACIIAEPLESPPKIICIGNRGCLRLQLTTIGETVHTGHKKKAGINAVIKMARLLLALQRTKFRYKRRAMFPKPKITAGTMIEGGTAVNIVPGECKALVDCRMSFGQTKQSALRDIKKVIKKMQKKDKELKVKMKVIAFKQAAFTEPKEEIVKICSAFVEKIYGFKPKAFVSGGGTDGNSLSAKGIPYIAYGPIGKKFHSENEFVEVKSIGKAAKAIALSAFNFLGQLK